MRHLALTLSIIGAILIAAGAIGFFVAAGMTTGIYALYALGGIGLGLGMIFFIAHFVAESRQRHGMSR